MTNHDNKKEYTLKLHRSHLCNKSSEVEPRLMSDLVNKGPTLGSPLKAEPWELKLWILKVKPWRALLRFNLGVSKYLLVPCLLFLAFFSVASAATLTKPPTNLGLVGYWPMNEGTSTVVGDMSGNGNNGTTTNMANPATATSGWNNGKRGNALNFDGVNDYASIPHSNSLEITGDITIAGWVKFISTGSNSKYCFEKGGSFNNSTPWVITCNNNAGNIGFNHNNSTAGNGASITSPNSSVPIGIWTHFAAVRDTNALTQSIYINGVLVTGPTAYTIPPTASGKVVLISAEDGPQNYSKDNFDELRIYNRTLSASEIIALYKSGAVTQPLPNNLGLVGYWSFNEGTSTVATDFSGNGNNGTLSGFANPPTATSGWANGKFGKALVFDSTNDTVDVGGASILRLNSGGTISVWVKLRTFGGGSRGRMVDKTNLDFNGGGGYSLLIDNFNVSNGVSIFINGNGATAWCMSQANVIKLNVWQHVAVTIGSSGATTLYVNGSDVSNNSTPCASGTDLPPNVANNVNIGSRGGASDRNFDGLIDEGRIYNRALSSDEVTALYKTSSRAIFANISPVNRITNGLVGYWTFDGKDTAWNTNQTYDRSGNSNTGTMTNMSTTTSPVIGKLGQAINCAGSGYVDVSNESNFDFTSAVAVSAWVKIPAYSKSFEAIIAKGDNAWRLARSSTNSYLEWATNGTSALLLNGTINLADNLWHHVVATYDGSRSSIYVDGVVDTSVSNTGSVTTNNIQVSVCENLGAAGRQWGGLIDEVRVYNRGLSAQEIKQLYLMGK